MLANSFCAFLCVRALVLVVFFLLHLVVVFTSASFSLTAKVSHGTLGLVLCLVGIHSAAAYKWALTKFSYLSYGVCVSVFCSASNLFLSANVHLSLICLSLRRDQSLCAVVVVRVAFFRRLSRTFDVTVRRSEDTPSKEEYTSQFNALLFYFLLIKR